MKRRLLLGPPGCGKTERLMYEVEQRLSSGARPDRVAFVTFTRAAAAEGRQRAEARFSLDARELPHFRTLHSLCFRELGVKRSEIFGRESMQRLSDLTGEDLTGHSDLDAPTLGDRGDALLFLDQYSRNSLVPLDDAWREHGAELDRFRLQRFVDAYGVMRQQSFEMDFTDLLETYVKTGSPVDVDFAFVDEAQDITPLQWKVIDRAFGGVEELIVAGDDDQAIYRWAGSDTRALLEFRGDREVLAQSYRLPRRPFELATQIVNQISKRFSKAWHPNERTGSVEWLSRADEVDLSTGTWLLLARTRRQLAPLVELARDQGVSYEVMGKPAADPAHIRVIRAWETLRRGGAIGGAEAAALAGVGAVGKRDYEPEWTYTAADLGFTGALPIWHDALIGIALDDREYLLSCLRRGEKLTAAPRVRISTIHGAKGLEADRVLLLTDLTERVERGMEIDPDSELRVLYVALSRTLDALFLVSPRGRSSYQF